MIFGLGAAFGWGVADLWAAISGRRIGSGATVLVAQVVSAIAVSLLVVVVAPDLEPLREVVGWLLPNALVTAAAYATLYRGLQLGPIAVVSPVLASYAVLPVLLAVVLLGESLTPWQTAGVAVTISGAVLTSTDLRALRDGTATRPAGLPWAVVSMLLFGVGAYVIAWASRQAGSLPSLWFGRVSSAAVFVVVAVVLRLRRSPSSPGGEPRRGVPALRLAAAVGLVDVLGTLSYVRGAEVGLVSVVTAVSATYPLLPVLGGVLLLHERPAPNQYLGVAMVVGGLALLGAA